MLREAHIDRRRCHDVILACISTRPPRAFSMVLYDVRFTDHTGEGTGRDPNPVLSTDP